MSAGRIPTAPRPFAAPIRAVVAVCLFLSPLAWPLAGAESAGAGGSREARQREVRRVLSENCFSCHGPDSKPRAGGRRLVRLDTPDGLATDLGDGRRAVVPGHPEQSELIRRISTRDEDDLMPPRETGKVLSARDRLLLEQWIREGGLLARHWAYVPPQRPAPPKVRRDRWPNGTIDRFILARLEREGLRPAPEASREVLARRVALDLTGLPPAPDHLATFLADREPGAFERHVDRLLASESYGEHWARLWLDHARYADSSGYADDPGRTIWAYRDYVIRSFNANKPFDRFTLEQIAGDLLAEPTDEQLVATAFHRNTMTNNEGGTSDEEYRNVAVVDRVNTTMEVWMATTFACAQCHNHKYDPFSQEEYFRLFAILNNSADADRFDEAPVLPLFAPEQKSRRRQWETEIAGLETILRTPTRALEAAQAEWEKRLAPEPSWEGLRPGSARSEAGAGVSKLEDGSVRFGRGGTTDVYTVTVPVPAGREWTGLRLEALPDETLPKPAVGHGSGNFVVTGVRLAVAPSEPAPARARYLRVELPGKDRILSLAEVQVFSGGTNVATAGRATQSSTAFEGPARLAIDGRTDGHFEKARSTTHTETSKDPWWELDLGQAKPVERVVLWNRTDGSGDRLKGHRVALLDEQRKVVWEQAGLAMPDPSAALQPDGARPVGIVAASAGFSQKDFSVSNLVMNPDSTSRGWAVSPRLGERHAAILAFREPLTVGPGSNLVVTIEHRSKYAHATLARVALALTADPRATELMRTPAPILELVRTGRGARGESNRTEQAASELAAYYRGIAPSLQAEREELARLRRLLEAEKPYTTVPILRELAEDKRRRTHLQRRGNFLDLGPELSEGLPSALHPAPAGASRLDRLALARWLVDTNNPLTARVLANRLWESVFGTGLVRTSEEFGAQGEPPSHPELLDWLAVELMERGWDMKHLLRLMVTSATYRQSSRVPSDLAARDPDNRLLARGPRVRLAAEMIRDQALAVSGLLSAKRHGPPVRPPQPKLGLSAAFGSATDWETSKGEDRYRRAIYTTWRRSNPYPSMTTFDAPNREVCLVRRERSNTPLQALVTLNDPVYVEAAQGLARRMVAAPGGVAAQAEAGFRMCLGRSPKREELNTLVALHGRSRERFEADPAKAKLLATDPLGPAPDGVSLPDLAAWTVVANVLLNLDEMLMKP